MNIRAGRFLAQTHDFNLDPNMRCTFSSPFTVLHKLLLLAVFLGWPCFFAVAYAKGWWRHRDGTPVSTWEWLGLGACCVAVGVPGVWCATRLKRVRADDRALYVSNLCSEISIPLTEVNEVTDGRFFLFYLSPATVTIQLSHPSLFGSTIVFIPRFRLYWRGLHPVARELKELVERARGRPGLEDAGPVRTGCAR